LRNQFRFRTKPSLSGIRVYPLSSADLVESQAPLVSALDTGKSFAAPTGILPPIFWLALGMRKSASTELFPVSGLLSINFLGRRALQRLSTIAFIGLLIGRFVRYFRWPLSWRRSSIKPEKPVLQNSG